MYYLKKIFFLGLAFILLINSTSATITGGVAKDGIQEGTSSVIDAKTKNPVPQAKIKIPQLNYSTMTDQQGRFYLDAQVTGASIMSVEKTGYRPFSLTLNEENAGKPLVLGIEKTSPKDIVLETNLVHIGDDVYSDNSANAGEFQGQSTGWYFSKNFNIAPLSGSESAYLVIGSVIGIDSLLAQQMGQSGAVNAYASPPDVYFNGQKIANIKCNGDGQKIKLPPALIFTGRPNEITIRCGKNLFQNNYIDYDDIEIMNLYIEVE